MGFGNLSTETLLFIGIILILTVIFHVRYNQKISEQAPTILTTLGIFATFFAIALGLLRFDSVNIQDSVPALLDSMKTAFWASVFGVGGALTFNFRRLLEDNEYIDESDVNLELLKELTALRSENNQSMKELIAAKNIELEADRELLEEIKELRFESTRNLRELTETKNKDLIINAESLEEIKELRLENNQNLRELTESKNRDYVLNQEHLNEIKELRLENNNNLKELTRAQNEALDKISKSSSEELIKALQEVIKDFNEKISEQFGENFKHLNDAVSKLLIWQDQYKDYIDSSTSSLTTITNTVQTFISQFASIVEDSDTITSNSEKFVDNSEAFKDIAEHLEGTLGNLDTQRQAIHNQLGSLSKLVSQASNDLPEINNQILGIANTMQNSATGLNNKVLGIAETMEGSAKDFNNQVLGIANTMQTSTTGFNNHVSDIATTMQSSAKEFNSTVAELSKDTKIQTNALAEGIEKALLVSLNTLGGQLSAMTGKFANDYNQLAIALEKISSITQDSGR